MSTKSKLTFGNTFSPERKSFFVSFSEEQALSRHSKGDSYAAWIHESNVIIEINFKIPKISVDFLDSNNRVFLRFFYHIPDNHDRIFLEESHYFGQDSKHDKLHLIHAFYPDGKVISSLSEQNSGWQNLNQKVDIECHWAEVPDFGEYDSFVERKPSQFWDFAKYEIDGKSLT